MIHTAEIYLSVLFYLVCKITSVTVGFWNRPMHKPVSPLTSIPESNEEDEIKTWVPKKKYEVLKAKYKCLKKLFQIYDASVIGILPPACEEPVCNDGSRRRKKRSHRTKTDASANTATASGDFIQQSENGSTIANASIHDLKIPQYCMSTQYDGTIANAKSDAMEQNLKSNEEDIELKPSQVHPIPYLLYDKPKLTRFQYFIQRICGIRNQRTFISNFIDENGRIHAASDNDIIPRRDRRRRRGLRFRKLGKPKKVQSEGVLDAKNPVILSFVQSVQKNCLTDTTPRHCPIVGCPMIFYGIINYNDHLNLCHFPGRKFTCHYCHEGFEDERQKLTHENEHIGFNKIQTINVPINDHKVSNTQTDPEYSNVPEEKLKKIVSFFDKIPDPNVAISEMKKKRCSESNLQSSNVTNCSASESDKRTASSVSLNGRRRARAQTVNTSLSYDSPVSCQFCGENFDYKRQLSLHVDLEHRVHDKYSKFHSCAGIVNPQRGVKNSKVDLKTIDKGIKISEDTIRRKSEESLNYEPSTNVIYYTSMESINSKVPTAYKWEPGTKIIRV
ncbi:hypothetical protein ACJJTC_011050 [Scirpophaga incertulas]